MPVKRLLSRLSGKPDPNGFSVRFWGTRGSVACGGANYARYGGNTSCLEVTAGGRTIIFDAGTGLRPFGDALDSRGPHPLDVDMFLTHTHFDHICGIPFFAPFYRAENKFRIWSGHLSPPWKTRDAVSTLMTAPIFPVDPAIFRAQIDWRDFAGGETITSVPGVTLKTHKLNHPNGATGFRIECEGKSICYITDMEHVHGAGPDPSLAAFLKGADIFIYDASYTDAEYPDKAGYGHSTWRAGLELAAAAQVKLYVLFHHDPAHDDRAMDQIIREARDAGKLNKIKVIAAREGQTLTP